MNELHVNCGRHEHRNQQGADECVARRFDRLVREGAVGPHPNRPVWHAAPRRVTRGEFVVAVYQEDEGLPYASADASSSTGTA